MLLRWQLTPNRDMTDYNNILLTGATGFIGRHIAALFEAQGVNTDTLQRSREATIVCNLEREIPNIDKRYDAVVHVAGTDDPARADALNNQGTHRLLHALEKQPPGHFTYISTVNVYGLNPGEDVREDCFLRPDTDYARSKIRAEKMLEKWCGTHSVSLTILRPAITIGPGMHGGMARMAQLIGKGLYMHLRGNQARRSLVMADDVAKAVVLTLGVPGVYNVTDGRGHTMVEIADAMAANVTPGKRLLTIPAAFVKWPLKLLGRESRLRCAYRLLTQSATYSSKALQEAVCFDPYDTVEVMARRHLSYPYKEQ